jgi:hypothetical protein
LAFSELELKRIEGAVGPFCRRRSPAHARHQVRTEYRVKGHDVMIVEVRTVWDDATKWMEYGVAKLKFNELLAKGRDLAVLVEEIDRDPHCCFFG